MHQHASQLRDLRQFPHLARRSGAYGWEQSQFRTCPYDYLAYVVAGQRVVRGGIEPPTFRFSGGRSYQLSYLTSTGVSEDQRRLAAPPR